MSAIVPVSVARRLMLVRSGVTTKFVLGALEELLLEKELLEELEKELLEELERLLEELELLLEELERLLEDEELLEGKELEAEDALDDELLLPG